MLVDDRDRIARDLHDLVIQRLFATGLHLQGARRTATGDDVEARLDDAVADLDVTIRDIRSTIFDLQDPDDASLRGELRRWSKEYVPVLGFTPLVRTSGPVDTAVAAERPEPAARGAARGAVQRGPARRGRRGGGRGRGLRRPSDAAGHRQRHRGCPQSAARAACATCGAAPATSAARCGSSRRSRTAPAWSGPCRSVSS